MFILFDSSFLLRDELECTSPLNGCPSAQCMILFDTESLTSGLLLLALMKFGVINKKLELNQLTYGNFSQIKT